MKSKPKILPYVFLCCTTISGSVFAGAMSDIAPKSSNHFEVIGALGIANLMAGDGYLGVTDSETDRLLQTNRNDWNTFTGQLGIGYVYYLHGAQQYAENTQWFPWIEPEVNGYYLPKLIGKKMTNAGSSFNKAFFQLKIRKNSLC